MVCSDNDTSINVTIPVVMIPQSAGKKMKGLLDQGARRKSVSYTFLIILSNAKLHSYFFFPAYVANW